MARAVATRSGRPPRPPACGSRGPAASRAPSSSPSSSPSSKSSSHLNAGGIVTFDAEGAKAPGWATGHRLEPSRRGKPGLEPGGLLPTQWIKRKA